MTQSQTGHWHYDMPFDIKDYEGFVYQITNTVTHKKYIGKKSFWSRITKQPLKGYKRKRKITKESNWKTYASSQVSLKDDYTQNPSHYTFEIIKLCKTKRELTYQETKQQFTRGVLEDDNYLNDNILGKFFKGNIQ